MSSTPARQPSLPQHQPHFQLSSPSPQYPSSPLLSNPNTKSNSLHQPSAHSHPSKARAAAPYMVALSGWPEPIYVSQPAQRSRPNTPRGSISGAGVISLSSEIPTEIHDGVSLPAPNTPAPAPKESILSRPCMYNPSGQGVCPVPNHPHHFAYDTNPDNHVGTTSRSLRARQDQETEEEEDQSFPTSSTRGTPHPSPPSTSRGPPRSVRFSDPRYAPHVAVLGNRPALPVVPSWSNSFTSSSPSSGTTGISGTNSTHAPGVRTGRGVKVMAGGRGPELLVMRAVPDVYPPPGLVGAMGVGVATEVYPRDPDAAVLWRGVTNGGGGVVGDGRDVDGTGRL